jgi:hypothetical protein
MIAFMKTVAFLRYSVAGWLGIAMLGSCGGAPQAAPFDSARSASFAHDDRRGIYVSEGSGVLGYRGRNRGNKPPICTVKASSPGGIAADSDGNLIDADAGSHEVRIFKGPRMCGRELGAVSDPYGQPSDVASAHAATGTIAVANIFDTSGAGSIAVCTLAGGCTKNLTNADMYEVAGVAIAENGDCWASGMNSTGAATLTYFKKCAGKGKTATGFENAHYGGLDIDGDGHLVSISAFDDKLFVYKGCAPSCTLVGGPYPLKGDVFGHLNENSTEFVAANYQSAQVDVYSYSPSRVTYKYSFDNGLSGSTMPDDAAYNGRARPSTAHRSAMLRSG